MCEFLDLETNVRQKKGGKISLLCFEIRVKTIHANGGETRHDTVFWRDARRKWQGKMSDRSVERVDWRQTVT